MLGKRSRNRDNVRAIGTHFISEQLSRGIAMRLHHRFLAVLFFAFPLWLNAAYVGLRNFENHVVAVTTNTTFTSTDMRVALIRGGAVHSWVMRDIEPGLIEATLNLRKHQLVMHISYTANSYSLKYISSVELLDNRHRIHDAYIRWCNNLMQATDAQAGAIIMERAPVPAATPAASSTAQ